MVGSCVIGESAVHGHLPIVHHTSISGMVTATTTGTNTRNSTVVGVIDTAADDGSTLPHPLRGL